MKKKKQLLLSAMLLLLGTGSANAQKAYTYVQQNGTKLEQLGTAAFDVSADSRATLEFDENGKAVMKLGENTVATLPMTYRGQFVLEFKTTVAETDLNKVNKTVSDGYATLYSPFQLTVPEGTVETYAPSYDATNHLINCTSGNKIAVGSVIPCETALLLKNSGTVEYAISAGASTVTPQSALSGSSLLLPKPEESGKTVYTLGHATGDNTKYGFYAYSGENLNPGLAYLFTGTVSASKAGNFVAFNFEDGSTTGVSELKTEGFGLREGKFIENGRVVILKNGQKYNINGQQVR